MLNGTFGNPSSSTRIVIAMANTPSLNASNRFVRNKAREPRVPRVSPTSAIISQH